MTFNSLHSYQWVTPGHFHSIWPYSRLGEVSFLFFFYCIFFFSEVSILTSCIDYPLHTALKTKCPQLALSFLPKEIFLSFYKEES